MSALGFGLWLSPDKPVASPAIATGIAARSIRQLQIRLLLRRLPASPSQAGPAPLRAHVPVPVPEAGASRLQPTRKA